jgi:hypothetical protein
MRIIGKLRPFDTGKEKVPGHKWRGSFYAVSWQSNLYLPASQKLRYTHFLAHKKSLVQGKNSFFVRLIVPKNRLAGASNDGF